MLTLRGQKEDGQIRLLPTQSPKEPVKGVLLSQGAINIGSCRNCVGNHDQAGRDAMAAVLQDVVLNGEAGRCLRLPATRYEMAISERVVRYPRALALAA